MLVTILLFLTIFALLMDGYYVTDDVKSSETFAGSGLLGYAIGFAFKKVLKWVLSGNLLMLYFSWSY